MSTLSLRSTAHPLRSAGHVWSDLPKLVLREWRLWRAARAVNRLDDAMLHDLGIGRSEIDGAVRHGRRATRRGVAGRP